MGPLSDKYGRKPFLLFSLFGTCFGKRSFITIIFKDLYVKDCQKPCGNSSFGEHSLV